MHRSNFYFLEDEFPILYNIGQSGEYNLYQDTVTTLFKIRQFGELLTEHLFNFHALAFPYTNTFHNRIKTLEEENILPNTIRDLLTTIKFKGNRAVHERRASENDGKSVLYSAFKVAKWFYETYSEDNLDIAALAFVVPSNLDARHALHILKQDFEQLQQDFDKLLRERSTKGISAEKQISYKNKSDASIQKIDMSEAETRSLIDEQLFQAGWEVNTEELNFKKNKTLPQRGKNKAIAEWKVEGGYADYALFIGLELYGFIEAKKYASDISSDLTQAKRYARKVEAKYDIRLLGDWRSYKVPFIFSTNGRPYLEQIKTKSGIWFLDVRKERNRSRALQGWISPEGLKQLYEQDIDEANQSLQENTLDYLRSPNGLNLRYYQIEAINQVEHRIVHRAHEKRALVAMATGTGKTRTINGLCYRLIKSNRFRRILFLVDRRLLALQAFNAFKDNKVEDLNTFEEIYKVSKLKELIPDVDTRLHFATVQSMVKRLFYSEENQLAVDTYDCIIVDEAHRGYLLDKEMDEEELNFKNQMDYVSKYRRVLEYFDAFRIGLTATPALHTREIFGEAVFVYSYREAVIDGFLIDHEPPYLIKTKLSEEGILWEKGEQPKVYDKEQNKVVALEKLEDELHIEIEGFNKLVITEAFNRTVIQELVKALDPEGEEKTLIFCAKDDHADTVVDLFKEEFEKMGVDVSDDAVLKITGKSDKPAQLVRKFRNEKYPNIVVTVDLLTTGVDVPPICNLVFLRRVKSRILYEQMLGRATRKCDEIGKEVFRIYDAVRIYEALEDYTNMKPVAANPKASFQQLAQEMNSIQSEERTKKQVEQIIAKLQRKKRLIEEKGEAAFIYNAQKQDVDEFIQSLKDLPASEAANKIMSYAPLWRFLDELKPSPAHQLVSEHDDTYLKTERGFGAHERPEDYLEGFERFVRENQNKIEALKIICTRPTALDRQSLKTLMLEINQAGFITRHLNVAWKKAKNEDIAADIISYIRTMMMGTKLISHEERIKNAVDQVRNLRDWTKVQRKWIDRFEKQLMEEFILKKEDLDRAPFKQEGGFVRLNKIFNNELEQVLTMMNEQLYRVSA